MAVIASGSHITLHYRLAVVGEDGEREVVSTLGGRPATLQLGAGHLAPELERRLIGLGEGAQAVFDLAAEQAFGQRSPDLIQSLTRSAFDQYADPGVEYHPGDVLEINVPNGGRLAGVLKDRNSERVVVDFNHPLAGMAVRFSVHVIGVL
jgi:FKBP-type peptidyl-prolyl cis-trans isomerase SlpA